MKFCPKTRPYRDTTHMTTEMRRIWNAEVGALDTVIILGDVAFLSAREAADIMNSLNGEKVLVPGNHDVKLLKDPVFRNCFKEIHIYHEIERDGRKIVMFHYPIAEWNGMHRGSIHFHGHLHGSKSGLEEFRCRDVSFDATGRIVSNLNDMIADAMKGKIKGHH